MEVSVAAVTVSVVLPLTEPLVAVIAALPTLAVLSSPMEPAALLTVATAELAVLQVTWLVKFCVV